MRITPIKGVTDIIFEVNLGKNSFANTVGIEQELELRHLCQRSWDLGDKVTVYSMVSFSAIQFY